MNTLEIKSNQLILSFRYSPVLVSLVKCIPGRRYIPETKQWAFPNTKENISYIRNIINPLEVSAEIEKIVSKNVKAEMAREKYSLKSSKFSNDKVHDYGFKSNPPPFKHQKICFNFLKRNEAALFLEMGTGKTRIVIDALSYRIEKKQIKKFLYVCPISLIDNTLEEFGKFSPIKDLDIVSVTGNGKHKRRILSDESHTGYIINYESLRPLINYLLKYNFDCIVCDESSRIKNPFAKRSKALHILGQRAKYKYIMTGTPITETPIDIFSQYKFLDPTIYGDSFYGFKAQYAIMGGYENHEVVGYKNLEELNKKMYSIAIRFTKEDCLDLPEKVYETRKFELSKEEAALYKEMKDNLIIELKNGDKITATILLTKMLRLSQITSGFLKNEEGKEIDIKKASKLNGLSELIEDIPDKKKIVIWCRFRHEIFAIQKLLSSKGISFVSFFGDTPQSERQAHIKEFYNKARVFIGNPQTGGLGINLTCANYVIFYSNDYSLNQRLQAEDRTHRIGQKSKVTYVDLLAKGTIDEVIYKLLRDKKELAKTITKENFKGVLEGII